MTIDIDNLSREELVALNRGIVERVKMLDTLATQQSMMQFHPGARVSFASSSGERLIGTLMKFNQKTVTIITDDGERWNLSSQPLSPIKDASRGNVIDIRYKKRWRQSKRALLVYPVVG